MNFGERIVYIREQKGYSQVEFAILLEMTPQSLVRYEKNKTKPSYEIIYKIHKLIDGVSGDWLISGNGNPFYENKDITIGVADTEVAHITISNSLVNMLDWRENSHNIEAMYIYGDSMEPTLSHNNILFIDKSRNNIEKEEGIYAFTTEHGLFVKRLQIRVDGKLDVISDNKEYPAQILNKEDLKILGKAINIFSSLK